MRSARAGDNHPHVVAAQAAGDGRRRLGVGDQGVDGLESGDLDQGADTELGMIGDDNRPVGAGDDDAEKSASLRW